MSHFNIFVFTTDKPTPEELDRLLAPYDGTKEVEPYVDEFLTDERADAMLLEYGKGRTMSAFLSDWYGHEPVRVDGGWNIMSTYNRDSKWDWWVIGGRWAGILPLKNGGHADSAAIKVTDWTSTIEKMKAEANARYDEMEKQTAGITPPDKSVPAMCDEGTPIDSARVAHRKHPWINAAEKAAETVGIKYLFEWPDLYWMIHEGGRDAYVESQSSPDAPYVFVTPDGQWRAKGDMGWFGMSDDKTSELDWNRAVRTYQESLLAEHPDAWVTVIDCHI